MSQVAKEVSIPTPRELTTAEVREAFIARAIAICIHVLDDPRTITKQDAVSTAVFSVLSMIDGSAVNLPAFILAPDPHPTDKAYCEDNGKNWYPENHEVDIKSCIRGELHSEFIQRLDKVRP